MQELKIIHSEFVGLIDIIAVDITPGVSLEELKRYGEAQNYPWLIGRSEKNTLQTLGVLSQSTKIGVTSDGTLIYKEVMGGGNVPTWREAFEQLTNRG